MEPTYLDQQAFTAIGAVARAAPGRHDYAALWGAFDRQADRVRPASVDGHYYGVHFPTEEPDTVDYSAGMAVAEPPPVAAGLEARQVPAGRYAVFRCTLSTIGATYTFIYQQWRPPEGYALDHTRPDIEVYPPDSSGSPDSPLEVRVPLRPAGSG